MKYNNINLFVVLLVSLLLSCEQKVSVKKSALTGINPVSYTDVVYKSQRDTVLVSTFDGRILELTKQNSETKKRIIIDLNDEVYSLAYNDNSKLIYASTLNKGVAIINEERAEVEQFLRVKSKWIPEIYINTENNILAGSDYDQNTYLWDLNTNETLEVSNEMGGMQPKIITNDAIYFDGRGTVKKWDLLENTSSNTFSLQGTLKDANDDDEVLAVSYDRFLLKNLKSDSLLLEQKHPNWPIYVQARDTTVMVPVSLPLTDALLSAKYIFTSSIDRSVRKWDKTNGMLLDNLLGHRATVSAITLSKDESQLASVDLKGDIKFWELLDK